MDTEEKARAYDGALERFKSFKEKYYTKDTSLGDVIFDKTGEMQKDFENIFHELRESEDERIRKELLEEIEFITPRDGETDSEGLILPSYHARIDRYKSYLEKQKEQKPESCDCSRDEESYTNGIHHVLMNPEAYGLIKQKPAEWRDTDMNEARNNLISVCRDWERGEKTTLLPVVAVRARYFLEHLTEPKPAEWSEDYDEENLQTRFAFYTYKDDPSVLYLSNVFVEETSRNHGFGTRILKAAEKVAEAIGAITIRLKVKQDSPANNWYRKHGYAYMTFEDGYDWLEKNLEYMKPNKQEWSEEDEKMIDTIVSALGQYIDYKVVHGTGSGYAIPRYSKEIDWLKSLRPVSKESLQPQQNMSIGFMLYLDEHRPEGKMSLSNAECEDIDKAFKENDWAKIVRYYEKYRPSWKPSEEQMKGLKFFLDFHRSQRNAGTTNWREYDAIESLYEQLKKLM